MPALSAILPGVREVRTPLAVGALWLATLALFFYPSWAEIKSLDAVSNVRGLVGAASAPIQGASLSFAAYVIGISAHRAAGGLRRTVHKLPGRLHPILGWLLGRGGLKFAIWQESLPEKSRGLLRSTAQERMRRSAPKLVPWVDEHLILDEFDLAELRLSKDAPDQYQQYDRLRSEAEFRLGIALPLTTLLMVFAFMLPFAPGLILGCVALVVGLLLCRHGIAQYQLASAFMASAIYFGYTSTPLFDSLVDSAAAQTENIGEARQFAWYCDFLSERGLFVGSALHSRIRHPAAALSDLTTAAAPYMSNQSLIAVAEYLDTDYAQHLFTERELSFEVVSSE